MRQFLVTDPPLVSVVIPAYNAERFISRTLESVLAQSYSHLEVLVINDGSTDCTATIVEWFAQQDTRIRLFTQPNTGVAAARNLAIRQAHGQFVAVIDADDLWYPDQITQQVACFCKSPDTVGLVYSWSIDIDEQDRPLSGIHAAEITGNVHPTLLCHNFLGNASCTMMRRSSLMQVGGYDEQFQAQNAYGCEDWDLYLRIAEEYEFGVVPEFLVGYRKLQHSMSYDYDRMARSHALMLKRVQQRHPQLSGWLYRLSRSSLYLYFGQQANQHGADREAVRWLIQAVRVDLTPWLRLGTYSLALKSLFKLGLSQIELNLNPPQATLPKAVPSPLQPKSPLQPSSLQDELLPLTWVSGRTRQAVLERTPERTPLQSVSQRVKGSVRVAFKVQVGKTLHTVLSLLGKR